MAPRIPLVRHWMSPTPHSIGADQTMAFAHELMRKYGVRHLPVLHGGKLVGLVSDRDLHLVETLREVDPAKVRVEDAMTGDPYTVDADTPLDVVVSAMAEHKYGSALVVSNGRVLGILTTVDVCRVLAALLRRGEQPQEAVVR